MKNLTLLLLLILFSYQLSAQETYTIRGKVTNGKKEALPGATVFIDGSQKAVATNDNGEYLFQGLSAGTYQIAVNMIGYSPGKQSTILSESHQTVDFVLSERAVTLKEVNIGGNSQRQKFMTLFTNEFIGTSANAKSCKLLNPETVDFSTEKNLTKATSDQFLIIENPNLGYRINYLLRDFVYNQTENTTLFDGQSTFVEMKGSTKQQAQWAKNRLKAYNGSLMHYLRSMYSKTSQKEGFITYHVVKLGLPIFTSPNPANPSQLVSYTGEGLYKMTYPGALYVLYYEKPSSAKIRHSEELYVEVKPAKNGSVFHTDGLLDAKGKYHDYKNAMIQGYWGSRRLGDQLPYEYIPKP